MRIDFGATLLGLDGKTPLTNGGVGEDKDEVATLGGLTVNALLSPIGPIPAEEKIRRARLAELAFDRNEVDLTPEQLTLIREAIGAVFPPLAVMRAFELLGGGHRSLKAVN